MKVKSLKPFNVLGVTSSEAGETLDIHSVVTATQLKNMGFVEVSEANETNEANEANETQKHQKQMKRASK
jgi:hypothetical protein